MNFKKSDNFSILGLCKPLIHFASSHAHFSCTFPSVVAVGVPLLLLPVGHGHH
jgi:hypothetical protein